jgi:glucose-6-phosphate isomerase
VNFRLGRYGEAVQRRVDALTAGEAVGRLWRRDATLFGADQAVQNAIANRLGWLDSASRMRREASSLEAFGREVAEAGFTDAVLLGMGGSSLAPEVLRRSFGSRGGYPRLHVLDSTDPATILAIERAADPGTTLFLVSSKSGTTIEVSSLFAHFFERVGQLKGSDAGSSFVAITDAGTPLERLAKERGFRRLFVNASDIGGRYSALSYFGLVPAGITGIDLGRLVASAEEAAIEAHTGESEALWLGATLGSLAASRVDKCTFVVSPSIESFGLWVEQLIAESTGKQGRGIVPVAGEPLGTPLHYGGDRLFVQLRLDGDVSGEQDGVVGALINEGSPAVIIDLDSPYDLGREFFRWEFGTAIAGLVLQINPFDEPNVQESKDNTARVLRELASGGTLAIAARDASNASQELAELLGDLAPETYFAVMAYVQQTERANAVLREVRGRVRDERRVATTLGYGPRFLHSTGQLHKGGPQTGVFLQVIADDVEDISIPGQTYTFGQLKRAQAIGDVQALRARGRPVLTVDLGRDRDAGLGALAEGVRTALYGRVGVGR